MPWQGMIGYGLIGWGPSLVAAMRFMRAPQLGVVFGVSSLMATIVWITGPIYYSILKLFSSGLTRVALSMLLFSMTVEFARAIGAYAYVRRKRNFHAFLANSVNYPVDLFYVSLMNGLGMGITITLLQYADQIVDSRREAGLFFKGKCDQFPTGFQVSAFSALFLNIFHVAASIHTFHHLNTVGATVTIPVWALCSFVQFGILALPQFPLKFQDHEYCGLNLVLAGLIAIAAAISAIALVRSDAYPAKRRFLRSNVGVVPVTDVELAPLVNARAGYTMDGSRPDLDNNQLRNRSR